jgi:hypothetical protein
MAQDAQGSGGTKKKGGGSKMTEAKKLPITKPFFDEKDFAAIR